MYARVLPTEVKVLPSEPKVLPLEPKVLPSEQKVLPFGARSTAIRSQKYCHRSHVFLARNTAGKYTNIFGKNEIQRLLQNMKRQLSTNFDFWVECLCKVFEHFEKKTNRQTCDRSEKITNLVCYKSRTLIIMRRLVAYKRRSCMSVRLSVCHQLFLKF